MADGVVVLDAWPVVEHYRGSEPAASAVAQLFGRSGERPAMSVVNFTEVCSALASGQLGAVSDKIVEGYDFDSLAYERRSAR